jgi:hypothetical protein
LSPVAGRRSGSHCWSLSRAIEILLGADDFDAATAERYGWINRAMPDQDLDAFVNRLANRIASFDQQTLVAVKALINRIGLPDPQELTATQALFIKSIGWEGARARRPLLTKADPDSAVISSSITGNGSGLSGRSARPPHRGRSGIRPSSRIAVRLMRGSAPVSGSSWPRIF